MPISTLGSCVSSFAAHTSNSLIGETAASGPSFNSDKYGGTLGWNFIIPSGPALTYWMVYDVRYWNTTTSAWDYVTSGSMHISDSGGTSGSHTVDWYVNSSLAAHGDYGITSYLVDESNVERFIVAYLPYYVLTHHPSFTPHPYEYDIRMGDDPPLTQPELPPLGPVGPGSSS